jgi:DNA (cytosine-5)-methyltransferase 1
VIGGAPCQTFSTGNVHFREDDARHTLPRKYACILRILNLKYELDFFVFENVKGITSSKHRQEYRTIKRLFSRAGFRLFEAELDAADFGVAQHRRRVFIVGINKKKHPNVEFQFPDSVTSDPLVVASKLKGLPEPLLFRRGTKKEDIPYHPNHWAMYPRSSKFKDGSLASNRKTGRSFRVLEWDRPSWTVAYGNREVHIHPNGHRRLSVYEAMLLQGLPEDYELLGTLSDQIRQISDAIPPQLGEALGRAIREALYS